MAMDSLFDRALGDGAAAGRVGHPPQAGHGADPAHQRRAAHPAQRRRPPMTRDFLHSLAMSLLNDRRRDILERHGRRDGRADDGQRDAPAGSHLPAPRRLDISLHLVPPEAPALDSLGLPAGARDLVAPGAGFVLVAAGPGGGKTTTLAALIDDLATQHPATSSRSRIRSRSCSRTGAASWSSARSAWTSPTTAAGLRAAARQDADVLMVGELGDREIRRAGAGRGRDRAARAGAASPRRQRGGRAGSRAGRAVGDGRPARRCGARFAAALRGVLHQRLVPGPKAARGGPREGRAACAAPRSPRRRARLGGRPELPCGATRPRPRV